MSNNRDLSRIARQGSIVVDNAQALRDIPNYGEYPDAVITLGALTEGDGGGGNWAEIKATS